MSTATLEPMCYWHCVKLSALFCAGSKANDCNSCFSPSNLRIFIFPFAPSLWYLNTWCTSCLLLTSLLLIYTNMRGFSIVRNRVRRFIWCFQWQNRISHLSNWDQAAGVGERKEWKQHSWWKWKLQPKWLICLSANTSLKTPVHFRPGEFGDTSQLCKNHSQRLTRRELPKEKPIYN